MVHLLYGHTDMRLQHLGQPALVIGREMDDDYERDAAFRWDTFEELLQRSQASGPCADRDYDGPPGRPFPEGSAESDDGEADRSWGEALCTKLHPRAFCSVEIIVNDRYPRSVGFRASCRGFALQNGARIDAKSKRVILTPQIAGLPAADRASSSSGSGDCCDVCAPRRV